MKNPSIGSRSSKIQYFIEEFTHLRSASVLQMNLFHKQHLNFVLVCKPGQKYPREKYFPGDVIKFLHARTKFQRHKQKQAATQN